MNLFVVASRVAGKTLLLMKDMGYDPAKLVYNAANKLTADGMDYVKANTKVNEAIVHAWKKAGLPDPGITNWIGNEPRVFIHELEHKILDPDFDLTQSSSEEFRAPSSSHSLVESLMEEALTWGFRSGGVEEDSEGAIAATTHDYILKGHTIVKDAIQGIATAPISNPTRKKIRDSVVHSLKREFKNVMGKMLDDQVDPNTAKIADIGQHGDYGFALSLRFLKLVEAQFDEWKDILETTHEESWKRFNLNLKNEINKIVPGMQSRKYENYDSEDPAQDFSE